MTTSTHAALELPAVTDSVVPGQRESPPEGDAWSDVAPVETASILEPHGASVEPDAVATERPATSRITGRGVVILATVALSATAALNVALAQGFTLFFDLCFVGVCLVAAMAVSHRDLFTTGVLPPLLLAAVLGGAALINPALFGDVQGAYEALMTGLAQHAPALVAGYAVALATLGGRVGAARAAG
ncbi:MAG TPA: DUF6542 domain-containing protein [Nocardioidaceae bacterium]|nr:DUF6542 domain-containing protein [Nocardioidaceae bacterium]